MTLLYISSLGILFALFLLTLSISPIPDIDHNATYKETRHCAHIVSLPRNFLAEEIIDEYAKPGNYQDE